MATNKQVEKKRDANKKHVHIKLPINLAERLENILGDSQSKQDFYVNYTKLFVESKEVQPDLFND